MSIKSDARRSGSSLVQRLTAGLFIALGASLAIPGLYLCTLGGSAYYLVAGLLLGLTGAMLWKGARTAGIAIYIALCAATLIWSVWEAGWDGWALLPRWSLFILLGILLLCVYGARRIGAAMRSKHGARAAVGIVLLIVVAGSAYLWLGRDNAHSAGAALADGVSPSADSDGEWPYTGGSSKSQRYSPLAQITPANVSKLAVAWKVHLGMPPAGFIGALQATPLMVNGIVYMCDMQNKVSALDLDTGKSIWSFDPHIDPAGGTTKICRGVAYHRQAGAQGLCSERIISFTTDARMFALDARTGRRCPGFGRNGEVSLLEGMGVVKKGYYYLTSAPLIVRGKIVVGGSVLDGQEVGEPSGVIRGFDVLTGKFAWAWDMGRPDDHGLPPPGETFTRGTPNAWAPMTGDEQLGQVYAPLGNATPDYLAAHRTPEMNKFASSVVALDADTGKLKWYFQTTHLDVWDYDIASPPTLVDFPTPQGSRPALIQPTKRGEFFVLDRQTGAPLVKTVERPVPQNTVAGEKLAPTQPYPVGMPSFGGDRLTEKDMWGLTPFDQLWCRIQFKKARYEGDFTPISEKPTIIYPGYLGGSEWAGVSVDPVRQLMVLNVNHFAMLNRLISRPVADADDVKPYDSTKANMKIGQWPQSGTRYATFTSGFQSPLQTPCLKPPYSEIAVVDLKARKTIWRQPLGTGRDTGPFYIPSMLPIRMGVPAMGGPLVTRSGLIFIAATQERSFRAFDLHSGKLLWQDRLPAGGHAAPMSYFSKRTGRQYIVIPASGHFLMHNGLSDYLIAYALPKQ